LRALARNLWWSWDDETIDLFREVDPVLWREVDYNPIALLEQIPIDKLEERASQLLLHSRINYAYRRMQEYLTSSRTWGAGQAGVLWARPVAYFSAEFGLHESIPIYSGGLGILAGDHLKSASDLGIPLIGVGLYYDQGCFRQWLDRDGWQQEDYIQVESRLVPMRPAESTGDEPPNVWDASTFVLDELISDPMKKALGFARVALASTRLMDGHPGERRGARSERPGRYRFTANTQITPP
jgi:starch phosphorylase